jgi:hypothetical protein
MVLTLVDEAEDICVIHGLVGEVDELVDRTRLVLVFFFLNFVCKLP